MRKRVKERDRKQKQKETRSFVPDLLESFMIFKDWLGLGLGLGPALVKRDVEKEKDREIQK